MSAGNAFLTGFMKQFNEKFSLPTVKAENPHRRLNLPAPRLADILCHHEQRDVGSSLSPTTAGMQRNLLTRSA